MARPTDLPFTWATNTNHADPGEAWDGLATKVAPSAGKQLTGFYPEERPSAEHFNSLINRLSQWALYLEELSDPLTARSVILTGEDFIQHDTAPWTLPADEIDPLTSSAAGRVMRCSLVGKVPSSAVITGISMMVDPGAARATVADRMRIRWTRLVLGAGTALPTAAVVGTERDDGTTARQIVTLTLSETVTKANGNALEIRSGLTADSDTFYWARINYTARTLDR